MACKAPRHSLGHRGLVRIAGLLVVGTIAAACGSNASSPTSTTPAGAGGTGTSAAAAAVVNAKSNTKLGTILVNGAGFTLYRLSADSLNKSVCTSACAKIWPPLLTDGSPIAGAGVTGLGTIKVSAGEQVTYHGMPLYTFTSDTSAGQTGGQDLKDTWGTWFAIVTKAPAGGTTTTAPGGGGVGF